MSIQNDSELDPLGFHFLPQEFCRLASRHSGNLPALTLLLRERHRAPDDASAGSSALSPASVAVSTRRYDHQPHEDDDSLADAVDRRQGGWTTSMEMDRRFCEAFDRITRQVAAVSFLQFIKCNSVPAGARVPRQPNGQLLGRKRGYILSRGSRGPGAESPPAGPENRKRVDCSRPSDGVHVVASKGTA